MRPYSPGGTLHALAAPPTGPSGHPWSGASVHRLRHGLPGCLIRFAPRAVASQRQERAGRPPSPLAFFPRSSHFAAPPGVPPSSPVLERCRLGGPPRVEPVDFTADARRRLHALYAQFHRVTLALHVLSPLLARSSLGLVRPVPSFLVPVKRGLQSEDLHPPRGVARSGFRLLPTIPHCCLLGGGRPLRGSPGRVSVPFWLDILSDQLPVVGLVGRYLTNSLIGREPVSERHARGVAFLAGPSSGERTRY